MKNVIKALEARGFIEKMTSEELYVRLPIVL